VEGSRSEDGPGQKVVGGEKLPGGLVVRIHPSHHCDLGLIPDQGSLSSFWALVAHACNPRYLGG
jgi:hypothetical protein